MIRRYVSLALVLALGSAAAPPTRAQPETFALAEGFEISLWAESPMFYNPTNIDVDAKGRIWVAEAVNYRDFNTARQGPLAHEAGDRIVILSDKDGDGRADSSHVFVQDKDLRAPLGLAVIGNRVVVSSSPHLIVYTDADGDDRPDKKEILLTGFGGFDHDHGLHAVVAGPDGRWYLNTGNAGPHVVTDRLGWTLRAGSLYTGGTPYNQKNQGGMVSDDGRAWTGGLALRMEPDGTRLTVLAHNFRNAYELAVDSFGDLWQNDNDDQVMACRMTWLMEGGSAGYFSGDGTRFWQADRRPGQDTFTAHWHQDDPGVLPAGDNTGAGAPAGVARYEGDAFGNRYRGLLLSADAGRNVIFGYLPTPRDAGFSLAGFDAVSSLATPNTNYIWNRVDQDRRKWFRPSDVAVGTDGAIYVADWFDPIVGGHQMQDGKGYGRIYRVTPRGKALKTPAIDTTTTAGQIQALLSPAVNVRSAGFERLKAAGPAALPAVTNVLKDANPYHRARAIWLLAQLGPAGVQEVERLLGDPDAQTRLTAFRALRVVKPSMATEVARLSTDPSPAVRREVALSLRGQPFDKRRDALVAVATRFDGTDRSYLEALGIGAAGVEQELYSTLLPLMGKGDPIRWDIRFSGIAWRLHPVTSVDAFGARASSKDVSADQRRQAIVALGFIDDARAAQAMADLTNSDLADVATQAGWWMTFRTANDWRKYPVKGWVTSVADSRHAAPAPELLTKRGLVLDEGAPIDRRIEATTALARDADGGRMLVQLAASRTLNGTLREAAGSAIYINPDRSVRTAAVGLFPPPGGVARLRVDDVVGRAGDRTRGEARFNTAGCATCHRLGSVGAEIGPDLSDIGKKFDRAGLTDAIVNPNGAIAFGFNAEVLVTRKGESVIGFILSDGPTVSVRDGYGRVITLAREDVESRVALKSSLMPDPLASGMSEQDVADIVAFLERRER